MRAFAREYRFCDFMVDKGNRGADAEGGRRIRDGRILRGRMRSCSLRLRICLRR